MNVRGAGGIAQAGSHRQDRGAPALVASLEGYSVRTEGTTQSLTVFSIIELWLCASEPRACLTEPFP